MSGHLPAVRARHQKYLMARLPRDSGDDHPGYVTSVLTVTHSVAFPEHTILETEAITGLVPISPGLGPTFIPIGQPVPVLTPPAAAPGTSSSSTPSPTSTPSAPSQSSSSSSASSSIPSPSSVASPSAPVSPTSAPGPASPPPSSLPTQSAFSTPLVSSPTSSGAKPSSPAVNGSNTSSSTTQSHGISGGAIGGIVVAILLVVAVIIIYAVRKVFLRRRQNRRISWGAYSKPDFSEKVNEKADFASAPPPPPPEKSASPPAMSIPVPPPTTYNNPLPPPPPMRSATPARSSTASLTLNPALGGPAVPLTNTTSHALVRCTFVPNLPDELSITTGETVRVLTEYDDGWALCQNARGEQGVVPLECLERGQGRVSPGHYLGQGTGDWRMSRRASSLYAAQNAGAARY